MVWSTFYGPYDNSQLGGAAQAPSGNVWVAGTSQFRKPSADAECEELAIPKHLGRGISGRDRGLDRDSAPTPLIPAAQYLDLPERLAFSVYGPLAACAWTATILPPPGFTWPGASGTASGTIPLAVDGKHHREYADWDGYRRQPDLHHYSARLKLYIPSVEPLAEFSGWHGQHHRHGSRRLSLGRCVAKWRTLQP